jgi:hypothetical protein
MKHYPLAKHPTRTLTGWLCRDGDGAISLWCGPESLLEYAKPERRSRLCGMKSYGWWTSKAKPEHFERFDAYTGRPDEERFRYLYGENAKLPGKGRRRLVTIEVTE